jgi:DMSO/TMAO reductase YedYZ heme-binding membrane subunit
MEVAPRPPRRSSRISPATRDLAGVAILVAFLGLALLAVSGGWSAAVDAKTADMRLWFGSRAAGIAAYLLVTALALFGLLLSHPSNKVDWKASRHLFPWHKHLAFFTLAFIAVHIATIVADPYAGVGILGWLVPGLSTYRTVPVALGTLALFALLLTGVTARFTNLLGPGRWLAIHRVALVAFSLAWVHGVLSGTDTLALLPMYAVSGALAVLLAASRYWRPLPRSRGTDDAAADRRLAPRFRFEIWR